MTYRGDMTVTRVTCPYCQRDMVNLQRVPTIDLEPKAIMRRKSLFEWVLDGFRSFRLW